MPDVADGSDQALAAEAHAFGRYLVGRPPPAELVARYRDASRVLFTAPVTPAEAAVVGFVRRHPWSVSLLDAATGLLRPASLLRSKILVMAAILETSPEFADDFLFRPVHPLVLALRVAGLGLLVVGRVLVGMALYPAAARSRA